MDAATLLFPLLSALLALLGIPLWIAMLPPNRFYGVRTPLTLADESLWYAANRAAGRDLVAASSVTLGLSVLLSESGIDGIAYALLMAVAFAACVACITLVAVARTRHLRSPL